jgi:citrate synthase
MPGWLSHWDELMVEEQRISRPRQLYTGEDARDYVDVADR